MMRIVAALVLCTSACGLSSAAPTVDARIGSGTPTTVDEAAAPAAPAASSTGEVATRTDAAALGKPLAIVDLATSEGAALVAAQWQYRDADVVPARGRSAGPDLRASGPEVETLDLSPEGSGLHPQVEGFAPIAAEALLQRRGRGKLSFGWYRTQVEIPARLGSMDTAGATVVLEVVVDDYAEVWIDGSIARNLGHAGGSVVAGFNAANRVVLTRDAAAGRRFDVAVFAMNGPVSSTPDNFLWIRSATLDFYRPTPVFDATARIERIDPRLDALVDVEAKVERVAGGFEFTEGPVWDAAREALLFSDPNRNTIYEWSERAGVQVHRVKSGYAEVDVGRYRQPGSNGLVFDRDGRLTIAQHGERRVVAVEPTGAVTVLADRWQGRRLNSPNDLVFRSDGSLWFTDPPFGLPDVLQDPAKELPFSGVYRLGSDGSLSLATTDLAAPNGIALSPDQRTLYVGNWDPEHKVIAKWPVADDGRLGERAILLDLTGVGGEECFDGIDVDALGNLWVSGPDAVYVVASDGTVLGKIHTAEKPANFAWGGADRRWLYMTARTSVYRIRTEVAGLPPVGSTAP